MPTNPNKRSARETATETAILTGFLFLITLAGLVVANGSDLTASLEVFASAGRILSTQMAWVLPLFVASLLAFYAVSVGDQILGGPDAAARLRGILGFVSQVITAFAIIMSLYVVLYCFYEPANFALLIVLVPTVGIVSFLGIQLGSFLVLDRAARLDAAKKNRDDAHDLLAKFRRRSRRSFWLVWILNATTVSAAALTFSVLAGNAIDPFNIVQIVTTLIAVTLCATGYTLLGLYQLFIARSKTARSALNCMIVAPYVSVAGIVAFAIVADGLTPGFLEYLALAVVVLPGFFSAFWPLSRSNRFMLNWSLRGQASRLVARSAVRSYSRSVRTQMLLCEPEPTPRNRFQRISANIRGLING